MIHRWILPGLETFDDIWLVGGWALPLWKTMEFVSWDDDIPNWMENKIHAPNHQPGYSHLNNNHPSASFLTTNRSETRNQSSEFVHFGSHFWLTTIPYYPISSHQTSALRSAMKKSGTSHCEAALVKVTTDLTDLRQDRQTIVTEYRRITRGQAQVEARTLRYKHMNQRGNSIDFKITPMR